MKTLIQILIIVLLQSIYFQSDTFAQDTVYFERETKQKFTPNPLKATMLAVALPGLGQIYNRKYWKIPLAYAGFGSMFYFIGVNSSRYSTQMKAYQDFSDDIPQTDSFLKIKGFESIDPAEYDPVKDPQGYKYYQDQLLRMIDTYKRYRDLSYIGLGLWYIASILDANVDASLFNYDVTNNLDITLKPVPVTIPAGYVGTGVNVSLMFNF